MPAAHADRVDPQPPPQARPGLDHDWRDLNARLRALLPTSRPANDDPLQPFRGLVVSEEEALHLLDRLSDWLERPLPPLSLLDVPPFAQDEDDSPLGRLCRGFRLSRSERRCLVAALAVEVDTRYERVFALLQDDITRKAPGVGLLVDLLAPLDPWAARRLFLPSAPLVRWRLLHLFDRPAGEPCPLAAMGARLGPGLIEYLLSEPAESEPPFLEAPDGPVPDCWLAALEAVLEAHAASEPVGLVLHGPPGVGQHDLARWLAREAGLGLHWADARTAVRPDSDPHLSVREALLRGPALALDRADLAGAEDPTGEALGRLAALAQEWLPLTIMVCDGPWPGRAGLPGNWFEVELTAPGAAERLALWRQELGGLAEEGTVAALAARFPLGGGPIRAVASQLRQSARLLGGPIAADRARELCRLQLAAGVPGVSEVEPHRNWDDLIVPADVGEQLGELCAQARHRDQVLGRWGFEARLSGGKGLHALFSGPPGTGKTLAAEVIAAALGRLLWRVDLAQLVSKYIGETEKNIDRVFRAAGAGVVLFFDEADALFGRRGEVKDAHDRYANQEVSYLLQQMEEYEGVAVLATNLSRNLDEAFLRRLQFVVDFPFPDEEQRRRIWEVTFPPAAPRDEALDLAALARAVRLSGGHIRNIVLAAAYLAAERDEPIGMGHLWHAARREHQKVGQSWAPPGEGATS